MTTSCSIENKEEKKKVGERILQNRREVREGRWVASFELRGLEREGSSTGRGESLRGERRGIEAIDEDYKKVSSRGSGTLRKNLVQWSSSSKKKEIPRPGRMELFFPKRGGFEKSQGGVFTSSIKKTLVMKAHNGKEGNRSLHPSAMTDKDTRGYLRRLVRGLDRD